LPYQLAQMTIPATKTRRSTEQAETASWGSRCMCGRLFGETATIDYQSENQSRRIVCNTR